MHSEPGRTTISSLTIHYTLGSFGVRNRLSGANADTKASSNATANVIALGNNISGSSDGH